MKNIYLYFLLGFLSFRGFSQVEITDNYKYKATYMLTYQPDSTDASSVKSELMVLYLGDKISRFSSLGTAVGDSLMKNRDKSDKSMAAFARLHSQMPKTNFKYYIAKGIPKGKMAFTQKIAKDNYRVIEDMDLFDWKIQPDIKEISGYKVQKAETSFAGRNYTAWFAPEIPISDGPYKFNGLPGLIMEVKDQKNQYSFVLTKFQKLQEPVPFKFVPQDYLLTKKEELRNVIEDYNSNPFAALERQGITIDFHPGQKEKMEKEHREELKKKNNPIELETNRNK